MSNQQLAAQVLLQVAVVLAACRVVGWAARRVGQPEVVGEMLAGVLLGPSLFGALAPAVQGWLFPAEAAPALHVLSQVGLCLYMFLVGAGLELRAARSVWREASLVSAGGTILPFVLGGLLALWILPLGGYFAPGVGPLAGALFLGSAMSITAFPVLARIIEERGLSGTPLGNVALAAASIGDAVAWCGLAFVLALAGGTGRNALLATIGTVVFAAVVLLVLRPLLRGLGEAVRRSGRLQDGQLTGLVVLAFLGAIATELIGVHAVFGAFLVGLALPRGELPRLLAAAIERPVRALFLPLFFVSSGLSTRVGLLDSAQAALVLVLVLAVATGGKVLGSGLASRLSGRSWLDAIGTGALMNARGLMELLALNVGLERGLISGRLFTVMVLMALATTILAAPLFHLTRLLGRAAVASPPDRLGKGTAA